MFRAPLLGLLGLMLPWLLFMRLAHEVKAKVCRVTIAS